MSVGAAADFSTTMGHSIQGLVITNIAVSVARAALDHTQPVALDQGLWLVTISAEAFDSLRLRLPASCDPAFRECFMRLGPVISLAKQLSLVGPVAYIETDYFGGVGTQSAALWSNGELQMLPAQAAGVINASLRLLGARAALPNDEFDTVGLGRHRSNEAWLKSSR